MHMYMNYVGWLSPGGHSSGGRALTERPLVQSRVAAGFSRFSKIFLSLFIMYMYIELYNNQCGLLLHTMYMYMYMYIQLYTLTLSLSSSSDGHVQECWLSGGGGAAEGSVHSHVTMETV